MRGHCCGHHWHWEAPFGAGFGASWVWGFPGPFRVGWRRFWTPPSREDLRRSLEEYLADLKEEVARVEEELHRLAEEG